MYKIKLIYEKIKMGDIVYPFLSFSLLISVRERKRNSEAELLAMTSRVPGVARWAGKLFQTTAQTTQLQTDCSRESRWYIWFVWEEEGSRLQENASGGLKLSATAFSVVYFRLRCSSRLETPRFAWKHGGEELSTFSKAFFKPYFLTFDRKLIWIRFCSTTRGHPHSSC